MPQDAHKRYGAYLPHWTKTGGIYTVNFRLSDSVPQKQLEQWRGERDDILNTAKALKRELSPRERLRLCNCIPNPSSITSEVAVEDG